MSSAQQTKTAALTVVPSARPDAGSLLVSRKPGTFVRWTMQQGKSLRAYETDALQPASFCVSTRSTELTFLLDGELWIEFGPARQQLRVLPGEACVILKGTPHHRQLSAGTRLLVFDIDGFLPGSLGVVRVLSSQIPAALDRNLGAIWHRERLGPSQLVEVSLEKLWPQIHSSKALLSLEKGHNTRRLLGVKSHLEHCYSHKLSLPGLAEQHGMDQYYLLRGFKKNFNQTPLAYVQFLRLEHYVWSMLRDPGQGHTDVALAAGAGDYSTFSRRVRRSFGVAPSRLFVPR